MGAISLYGIPNCDTVKKARAWLGAHEVDHVFIDFKKTGVPLDRLQDWAAAVGWDKLINRQGTTWRQLDVAGQLQASSPDGAQQLAVALPSVIKRPLVEWAEGLITVGFSAEAFAQTLHKIRT